MAFKPIFLINKVLILPDADYTASGGVIVGDHNERHIHRAVTGVVLKAPTELRCEYKKYLELRKNPIQSQKRVLPNLTRHSLPFLPSGVQIKEGDRVMFRYVLHMTKEKKYDHSKTLICDHTDIFCKLDEDNNPTPINGYLLVSPETEQIGFKGWYWDERQSKSTFIVQYTSETPNLGYISDIRQDENIEVDINQKVLIRDGIYRVINHPLHPVINHHLPLMAIHRKDILATYEQPS